MTTSPEPSRACRSCGAPLDAEQRYCFQCGERTTASRVDYTSAWGGSTDPEADAPASPEPTDGAVGLRERLRRLPRAVGPIAAAVTLLLGVAVGALISAGTSPSDAATSRTPLILAGQGAAPAPAATTAAPVAAAAVDDTAVADDTVAPDDTSADTAVVTPDTAASTPIDTGTGDDASDQESGDDDLGATGGGDDTSSDDTASEDAQAITNVWVITLGSRTDWFSSGSRATYLAKDLAAQGAVLSGYTPAGTGSASAGIALLSGQGPNDATAQDCPVYSDVTPATVNAGLATGTGCVYPGKVDTLAAQLTAKDSTWRAYVQGQGAATPCRHPAIGDADPWRDPAAADGFLTSRDPFVFFHSIIDTPGCATDVLDYGQFATDVADPGTIATLSWIVPDARHDGRDLATGGGPEAADAFLRDVVTKITATRAYRDGGLILVVPDGPAAAAPPAPAAIPAATGALVLSPLVTKGATSTAPTGPYTLLRTIEDRLDLSPLGHAGDPQVSGLGDDVFTAPTTSDLR